MALSFSQVSSWEREAFDSLDDECRKPFKFETRSTLLPSGEHGYERKVVLIECVAPGWWRVDDGGADDIVRATRLTGVLPSEGVSWDDRHVRWPVTCEYPLYGSEVLTVEIVEYLFDGRWRAVQPDGAVPDVVAEAKRLRNPRLA